MRSKLLVCAAIAAAGAFTSFGSAALAAGAKKSNAQKSNAQKSNAQRSNAQKSGDKSALELHADDKSMKKQLQWEDKVMGPDSKRAELDKIARAHAITEKAEKDRERQAALEPAPRPERAEKNRKAEVALPSTSEEKTADENRPHDISPKLETAAAQAPVPAAKPADDKFIDKLLREEDAPSKKRASANDRELESLLAGANAKEKPAGRKRADSVDNLLKTADKGPAMPAPRAQSGLPEWAKQPDIAPSAAPSPPPVALRAAAPKNDGVIHVVQGAAVASAAPPARTLPPARGTRRGAKPVPAPVAWSDPFADKKTSATYAAAAPKKEAASHPSAAPSGSAWNDPFADGAETRKTTPRRAAPVVSPAQAAPATAPRRNDKANEPSHPTGWKDPFTKAPTESPRTQMAMRDLGKNESSKWEIAAHHAPASHASGSDAHAAGGWSVLKKRAR